MPRTVLIPDAAHPITISPTGSRVTVRVGGTEVAATDAGINFLDNADFYPMGAAHAQFGSTEEITGRWLKGKRHRFIVASKQERRWPANLGPGRLAQASARCD